ncbi:MAG TPA: zf-HC2 domain-containing protein [Pyrinomonadaceae bacterium]
MTKDSNNTSQETSLAQVTSLAQDASQTDIPCAAPELRTKVSDYIFDLLDDAVAFEVEKHLAGCTECKEKYLSVLRVRAEAMEKPGIETGNDPVETDDHNDPETETLEEVKN